MDLFCTILFLIMYYLRPQEWTSLFATVHFVQLVMIAAIVSLFMRERQFRASDLLKTPHDWAMLFFFGWIVLSSRAPFETFRAVYPLALFYIVIVQTLFDVQRMKIFVGWWTFLIVGVACLALASEHGFDPLGGYEITHGMMKDRLMLNLSIFNNPNGLGHSVVPSIAMLYFFCIWRRPIFMKQLGLAFIGLPLWCIWLTVSKGAFLSGAGCILATLCFGRPKTVQIMVVCMALMVGGIALAKLPRMSELDRSKTDPAIQGRVAAFKHGLKTIETEFTGVGYGNWITSFFHAHHYAKAAHSSYVQIGAELGYPGFFFLFGIFYCNLRTLLAAQTRTDDEERIRRILFVLVLSYMVSSWMVDFGYRPTFFMFTAAVAAFHRYLYGLVRTPEQEQESKRRGLLLPAWRQRLLPPLEPQYEPTLALAMNGPTLPLVLQPLPWQTGGGAASATVPAIALSQPKFWNRIGWLDLAVWALMANGAVHLWAYLVSRM